jgi:ParB family chromosome partitioning protein
MMMSAKRTGLGRGLDALLGDAVSAANATDTESGHGSDNELRLISVDLMHRGTYQPRLDMHQDSLEDLADSIRAQGVIQPIVVRSLPTPDPSGAERYEIVAGERRWRAAQIAGLQKVPAVVRNMSDSAAIAVALIENIQREDLNPLEEARALRRLIDEFELTHQEVADAIGRSRTAVSNILRLQDLGDPAKALLQAGELEMGHARALLAIADALMQAEVAALVAKKGLSVRETERLIKRVMSGAGGARTTDSSAPDPDIRRLQDDLAERLGARVSIQHGSKGRGKLVITYNSLDELDGILAHIQ